MSQPGSIGTSVSPRVAPAQLNFLTIYNPTLGDTDETERDQIVLWIDREELYGRRQQRPTDAPPDRIESEDLSGFEDGLHTDRSDEEKANDRLRQIGLARGMAELVKNFAPDKPLDTIETDRSRIVLHELEANWWILASIDLTRLPVAAKQNTSSIPSSSHAGGDKQEQSPVKFEYSAREVSPAILLRVQLVKAHNLFLLHQASSLWELYHKVGKDRFQGLLERYWSDFARNGWDVLLHGNPAVDVFGDCVKLAGGGELGVGVGEEEWGSGEREVLEGLAERLEGCLEFIVGRYGVAPPARSKNGGKKDDSRANRPSEQADMDRVEKRPWLGSGDDPGPSDGLVFSGMGTISRKSLATVSQWMEAIFKHGDAAYGIRENPSARPRQRRKKKLKIERQVSSNPRREPTKDEAQTSTQPPKMQSPRSRPQDLRRTAMTNNASPPGLPRGIPAPLVGAVERSLEEAMTKVTERSSSKSPKSSPTQEKTQEETMRTGSDTKDDSSSVFSMEGMKNMFTFGYGTSWTLNPRGLDQTEGEPDKDQLKQQVQNVMGGSSSAESRRRRPRTASGEQHVDQATDTDITVSPSSNSTTIQRSITTSRPAEERLQEIDPTPEVSDGEAPFMQKLEQSIGRFLVGLSGDLENTEFEDAEEPDGSGGTTGASPTRLFHRTLTVELAKTAYHRPGISQNNRPGSQASLRSKGSVKSKTSIGSREGPEPKTSAAASVDGASAATRHEKVQVAVYVHQPFVFVFLFELHTPSVSMPSFYRSIHHQLGPLQGPLLQRTDPGRVAERFATVLNEKNSAAMSAVKRHVDEGNTIYDLVYDPSKNTIRTSVPNIPVPTSPDAVIKTSNTVSGSWYTLGIPISTSHSQSTLSSSTTSRKTRSQPWTRVEALNVHTQMLQSFSATRSANELERTVKTTRGWWVLWMKVTAPAHRSGDFKEAFLVRKSSESSTKPAKDMRGSTSGRWLLRDQSREVSGGSASDGSTGARGVSEGVGIDARRWIDGLLSLTQ